MPNEFTVVGESKEDDRHLLVLGADGNYYGYYPEQEDFIPVEPDDSWQIQSTGDSLMDGEVRLASSTEAIAS